MTAITIPQQPRLRLTARGRGVLLTIVAAPLVLAALALGVNAGGATASNTAATAGLSSISVPPGGTLWQVAEEIAPSLDPREVIAELVSLNQLPSADVQAGQELYIPVQYAQR